jgi:hypothetical protein
MLCLQTLAWVALTLFQGRGEDSFGWSRMCLSKARVQELPIPQVRLEPIYSKYV